jgi:UDP-glucose 4-epimerase
VDVPLMPAALVTGSEGFIGRHFAARLRDLGWDVTGIDVKNGQDAREYFRYMTGGYDLVIHAAAVVGGREVIENNPLAQAVNLELDAGLYSWARRARPRRIVYFSSSAVYPVSFQRHPQQCRLGEADVDLDAPQAPDRLYGWAKLTGEYLSRLARQDGQAVTVVRPFSGYGPDQDDTYPLAAFADRALARQDPFLIWGDGRQVRDFIHVGDIVTATLLMADREVNGPLNLGRGEPVSMTELARMTCRQAGYEPVFEYVPAAPAGVDYRVADASALHRLYDPQVTLEQGVSEALEYRK